MKIKIQQLDPGLPLPQYQHGIEDAGLDLFAREDKHIAPGSWELIKTGIKIAVPQGYAAFVYPRSGLALKKGVTVLNADGVIDPGYRGEVGVILINHGKEEVEFKRGERIAQLIVQKVEHIQWEVVDSLEDTRRGSGGFGHTGT